MNARMFNGNNLPYEMLSTTRQTTKLRNATENNMSTGKKLYKAQIFKIIQSEGFLASWSIIKNEIAIIKVSHKTTWFLRSHSSFFSNRCWNSKKYIWKWFKNFSNFK